MRHKPATTWRLWTLLTVFGAVSLVAGCATVESDENQITIEHAAAHLQLAILKAEDYCRARGKTAVLVQTAPREAGFLGVATNTSLFKCVTDTHASQVPAPSK